MGNCCRKPDVKVTLPEIKIAMAPVDHHQGNQISGITTNNGGGNENELLAAKPSKTPHTIDLESLHSGTNKQDEEPKFQHILEAVYDAAMKAHMNVQINNLHQMFWMFPKDENDVHIPKCIKVAIPGDEGHSRIVDVPVFTLMSHNHLSINKLKLETTLDVGLDGAPLVSHCVNDVRRKEYSLKLVPGKRQTKLEVEMTIQEPIEVYHRLAEKYERGI